MAEEQTNLKPVELGDKVKGEIELPTLDIEPYIGMKVKIAEVGEFEGKFGYFVKVVTETVGSVGEGDKKFDIKASRIFGLHEDKQGDLGWAKTTKLGAFLEKMGVGHYKDLIGKEVRCQATISQKNMKDYLSFI